MLPQDCQRRNQRHFGCRTCHRINRDRIKQWRPTVTHRCCRGVPRRRTVQRLACTANGIAFAMKQPIDIHQQRNIGRSVIAPSARPGKRTQHLKMIFPIAQDMLPQTESLRHFANRAKRGGVLAIAKQVILANRIGCRRAVHQLLRRGLAARTWGAGRGGSGTPHRLSRPRRYGPSASDWRGMSARGAG